MEREAHGSKNLFNLEDEIPWVTSGLYYPKEEECQAKKSNHSYMPEGMKKHQCRRQSEPVVSKILEACSPRLMHQNKFALYSGTNDEFESISYLPKGTMKQTFMHTQSAENSPQIRRRYKSSEKCFIVNLYIEAKAFHLGPFAFEIYPKMNVGLLKLKVEKELEIPTSFQKWILNKSLAIDNDLLLMDYDVVPGSPIFLYVDSNFEKSIDLDRLYSLVKVSANKSTHRNVDVCHNTFKQYPVKTSTPENSERVASGKKPDPHIMIKNPPKKKCEKLDFEERERRKKKLPEHVFENCSQKSNSAEMDSEKIFPTQDVTVSYQKNSASTNKRPFKPVFSKVKGSHTLLNNVISGNACCSTKTDATGISKISSENTSNKYHSDCSVAKDVFKSQIQIEGEKMNFCPNVENSNRSMKDLTVILDRKNFESKKHVVHDLEESVPSSSLNYKIPSSKFGQNSILEKVRMKQKIKLKKENENLCIVENIQNIVSGVKAIENSMQPMVDVNASQSDKNENGNLCIVENIQNIVSEGKAIENSIQPKVDVNASQNDILPQSNLQSECGNSSHDFFGKIPSEIGNIENNQERSTILPGLNEEERPDCAEIPMKDSETEDIINEEKHELTEISTKDLKAENLTDSAKAQNIESIDKDVFRESEITEICIVNNTDKSSSEIHDEYSNSTKNITDSSSSSNNRQEVQEKENEVTKKCAEDYEHMLKMEDLNLVRNVVNFTCPVCFGDFESDQGVVLHECLHTFCIDCLARTIDYAEEVLVKCPYRDDEYSCQSFLQQREIKALVSPEIYERYLQRSIITAESLAEKSFHCKTPDCPGWYNIKTKLQSQKKLDPDSEKTLEFLNKMIEAGKALKCPKCDLILMKKWGCDWLKCAVCLTEICWITKGPRWGPGGQGDTSGGCRCGVNGIKCHPSCTYCH
ncbi:RanBP-type and C3HC4-type zinc like protein [Argiope bruennichi]|uniref:RanBP-type and C3HC4-type zinc like protein n=1 Tax=Argiope bruennichi TaxID=94029 RepID=A0A8T0EVM6_ARGBR|nr:RanBP-type and C3HC4-type zinc like protein [Argiope bruennichi]